MNTVSIVVTADPETGRIDQTISGSSVEVVSVLCCLLEMHAVELIQDGYSTGQLVHGALQKLASNIDEEVIA